MPQLARVLIADNLARRGAGTSGLDLAPYLAIIKQIGTESGVGGTLDLALDEDQRTEKGRLTRAAKVSGRTLVWRKAPAGQSRFVLAEAGGPVPVRAARDHRRR